MHLVSAVLLRRILCCLATLQFQSLAGAHPPCPPQSSSLAPCRHYSKDNGCCSDGSLSFPLNKLPSGLRPAELQGDVVRIPSARSLQADGQVTVDRYAKEDEVTMVSHEETISGTVELQARIPMGLVAEVNIVMKGALASLCGTRQEMMHMEVVSGKVITASTSSSIIAEQLFTFMYKILPPRGFADSMLKIMIEASGTGLLSIFSRNLAFHEPTQDINVFKFVCTLNMPSIMTVLVARPLGFDLVVRTTAQPDYLTQPRTTAPGYLGDCMATNACICASIPNCAWDTDENGVARCAVATNEDPDDDVLVSCADCPSQSHCERSACNAINSPCACANYTDTKCRWDLMQTACVDRGQGSTPCSACAQQKQAKCDPPFVASISPAAGTLLRMPAHAQIRVTFDREVTINNKYASAEIKCDSAARSIFLPRQDMTTSGQTLLIGIQGAIQQLDVTTVRICHLMIREGTVGDYEDVPFLGMYRGTYSFKLGDSSAPELVAFSPENGETEVPIGTMVTLTYSEQIYLPLDAANLEVTLTKLESDADTQVTGGRAVQSSVGIKLSQGSVVSDRLTFDLSGTLLSSTLYSLSLPPGAVVDASSVGSSALPLRHYTFRTSKDKSIYSVPGENGLTTTVFVAMIAVAVAFLVLCLGMLWRLHRLQRVHARVHTNYLAKTQVTTSQVRPSQNSSAGEVKRLDSSKTPKHQAPLRSFHEPDPEASWASQSLGHSNSSSFGRDLRHSESVSPDGVTRQSSMKRESTSNLGGREASSPSQSVPRRNSAESIGGGQTAQPSVASAKSMGEKKWAEKLEAQRRWQQAFAEATAPETQGSGAKFVNVATAASAAHKRAAQAAGTRPAQSGPTSEAGSPNKRSAPQRSSTTRTEPDPASPGVASTKSDAGRYPDPASPGVSPTKSDAGKQKPPTAQTGHEKAKNERAKTQGNLEKSQDDFAADEPELRAKKQELERKLRDHMKAPIADRKKMMKEFMLEYHPDKNSDRHAKEIFQFINASKNWFLVEP